LGGSKAADYTVPQAQPKGRKNGILADGVKDEILLNSIVCTFRIFPAAMMA
jgi:hypothetical protein